MFMHSVYFWLKPDLSDADREAFVAGAKTLLEIPSVKFGFLGTPADTDRPVIDRSYSYSLIVGFEDSLGHDEYQVHPLHDEFREDCEKYWAKVLIYDAE